MLLGTLGCTAADRTTLGATATFELGRPHAFVDDSMLDSTNGSLSIRPHEVKKNTGAPAAVQPEHPWELQAGFYTAFLAIPPLTPEQSPEYRIYYMCLNDTDYFNKEHVCVANSSDLVHWEKPRLHYFPWTDGSPTNRVFETSPNENMGSVWLDDSTENRRFLFVWENTPDRHLYITESPDGLGQWSNPTPIITTKEFADTQTALVHL